MGERFGETSLVDAILGEIAVFSGEFGCYAKNLATGEELGFRADAVMPTASTIKVCVLAELYRQVEQGEVKLDDRLTVTQDDWYGGSGALKEFAPGLMPTINDLARMMIVLSDNVATGMLVRLLGKDRINATMRAWGLNQTELVWKMELGTDIRNYALSTPRELGRLMELIATDAAVSPDACAAMRDHLARQQYVDQIPRYLPFNPYAYDLKINQPVGVMNKTGFYTGVRVDAAIVRTPRVTFVMATMADKSKDRSFQAEHEASVLSGSVARLVFDRWAGALPLDADQAAMLGATTYLSLAERLRA